MLPVCILMVIDEYAMEYVLITWLVRFLTRLDWSELSRNSNAVSLLENNLDKIDWTELSRNSEAASLLGKKFRQSKLGGYQ